MCATSMGKSSIRRGVDVCRTIVVLFYLVLGIISCFGLVGGAESQQLRVGFYDVTCPAAEQTVRDTMISHFQKDQSIAAQVLRIQFHDCAATGCDASLLLTGSQSEQKAPPNLSLRGLDVVEDIKTQVEAKCPGVVSCADIITIAARDALFLTGGPIFSVALGRFDSKVSGGTTVNLPSPSSSVPAASAFFHGLGLSTEDMVALLGSHTIGAAHCSSFNDRLFNFNNTGSGDPSMDPSFLATLQKKCPQTSTGSTSNTLVALDLDSEFVFDDHYFQETVRQHAVLRIDQELFTHPLTKDIVAQMAADENHFSQRFADALIRMSQIGIKSSATGVIRLQCSG